jgi:23S rRNA pseudouridine1911/1915/1917 synthase
VAVSPALSSSLQRKHNQKQQPRHHHKQRADSRRNQQASDQIRSLMTKASDCTYCENHGRIYKCGAVTKTTCINAAADDCDASTITITLFDYLCTITSRGFKEAAWRRRILRGDISVEESIVTEIDYPLKPGCRVFYHRPPWNEPVIAIEDVSSSWTTSSPKDDNDNVYNPNSLKILYRDEHLMAVHKPSGLPTMHSQTFVEYTVLNALRTSLSKSNPSFAPPQPVHRLGVGTSGVLLIATSLEGRKALSLAIREKRVKKVYRALVRGADIPDSLRIDCPIGPVPFPIGGGTIYAACPTATKTSPPLPNDTCKGFAPTFTGKASLSLVRVVRRNAEANEAVVDVEIPTGRPHQIRIHMAYSGHPLVGDPLYLSGGLPDCEPRLFSKRNNEDEDMDTDEEEEGGEEDECVMRVPLPRDCGYSLHAHKVTVEHPTNGNWMTFTAKPPKNLT